MLNVFLEMSNIVNLFKKIYHLEKKWYNVKE